MASGSEDFDKDADFEGDAIAALGIRGNIAFARYVLIFYAGSIRVPTIEADITLMKPNISDGEIKSWSQITTLHNCAAEV
ncbi:MAG TPA: hypothetical protein EYH50_03560 [Pyrodictium delaneyi]|uniref:Uncharacterized protein n=1 Tax=Pyrodictium delaneyi TaxID=1273541 RepID=A0A833E8T3_9CREN|nr:hypothetical protein [Pyrodictium delaneyi]